MSRERIGARPDRSNMVNVAVGAPIRACSDAGGGESGNDAEMGKKVTLAARIRVNF